MPNLERDDVERALRQKGFIQEPGDHRRFLLHVEGKYTGIQTKTSHGTKYKTLGNALVSEMAKQLKLTTPEFRRLVECTLTGDGLLTLLRDREEL